MRAGWITLATLIILTYAVLYYVLGKPLLIGTAIVLAVFIAVFCISWVFKCLCLVCDGQWKKIRPTPELPWSMRVPDIQSCVGMCVAGCICLLPLCLHPIYGLPSSKKDMITLVVAFLGILLLWIGIRSIFKKRTVATVTEKGIHSQFRGILSEKRDFIPWHEIEHIRPLPIGQGQYKVRTLRIEMKHSSGYLLPGNIYSASLKELTAWFQEYLDRYGSRPVETP